MISVARQLEQKIEQLRHLPLDVVFDDTTTNPRLHTEHIVDELQLMQFLGHETQLDVVVLKY